MRLQWISEMGHKPTHLYKRFTHQKEGNQRGHVAGCPRPFDRPAGRPRSDKSRHFAKKALELWQNRTRSPSSSLRFFYKKTLDLCTNSTRRPRLHMGLPANRSVGLSGPNSAWSWFPLSTWASIYLFLLRKNMLKLRNCIVNHKKIVKYKIKSFWNPHKKIYAVELKWSMF